mmetsp:Transcript_2307/g.2790  ORF Transcript_2307/g.2790 Transcript_2307/m.2790 type:complete len:225 (+) Transcript_2307:32-706(+)
MSEDKDDYTFLDEGKETAQDEQEAEQRVVLTIEHIRELQDNIEAKQKKLDELNAELAVDRETLRSMLHEFESNNTNELSLPGFLAPELGLPSFLGGGTKSSEEDSFRSAPSPQGFGLERQECFKSDSRMHAIMKGASVLKLSDFHKYDTKMVSDPTATPSNKIKKAFKDNTNTSQGGDGDIWIEKLFLNKNTGQKVTFFVSENTGQKVRDEPPSGASKVIFLKH